MDQARQSTGSGQEPHNHRPAKTFITVALALGIALSGCDSDAGTLPDNLRFGQVGQVQVQLDGPLGLGEGSLHQILTWGSSGAWSLREYITYRGLTGDETLWRNPGDPAPWSEGYAAFITSVDAVDGVQGWELFIDDLPQDLDPECDSTRTRITLIIRDDAKNQSARWVRCTEGSLSTLTPVGARPDPAASRVVQAAQLVRNGTVGERFLSAYHGSVPFGTLARGDDTDANISAPQYLLTDEAWSAFWLSHAGSSSPPAVDFGREMVIVAAVGTRGEAGDSVEVRRILRVDEGTLTYVFERAPGDFCSPAARTHVPFHVVVARRTPAPYRFADIEEELVTCGG